MPEELFDLVDAANRPLGAAKPRHLVHRDGDWHRAIHVWVFDAAGRLLLQRRSATKDLYPNVWAVSVGGHVDAGEDYLQTALREMWEELGWRAAAEDLTILSNYACEERYGDLIDREHMRTYTYRLPVSLDQLRPDPEEVVELRFFTWDELDTLWRDHPERCSPSLAYWTTVRALLT